MVLFYIALFFKFFGNYEQFFIPLLAKAFDKRFFEKLVCAQTLATAFYKSTAAHIPFVKIDRSEVAHLAQAHRVKVARNWFAPPNAPLSVGPFDEADAAAIFVVRSKNTVFAIYDRCHKVAIAVVIHHALLVGNGACFGRHLAGNNLQCLLEFFNLLYEDRRTGITLNAAYTLAMRGVATKIFLKKVERNNCITYLYHTCSFLWVII